MMKSLISAKQNTAERGVAIIVVLMVLVLVSFVTVLFMTATKNDLVSTAQYAEGQDALVLSEAATNLVIGQISEATTAGIDSSGLGTYAWASQPGALRVWNQNGGSASPHVYKLYSASTLKEDDLTFLSSELPADWRSKPDEYVDLNEPVKRAGSWSYPILDPRGMTSSTTINGQTFSTSGTAGPAGFRSSIANDAAIPWDTRASMPVRWIYVNAKGEMSDNVQEDSVGRIAFWTDDETSKVNLNTASFTQLSGTARAVGNLSDSYWDIPSTQMATDYAMGRTPPFQDEFQRYPGHPATVNLGAVLQLSGTTSAAAFSLEKAFSLVPRYKWGGSSNGTQSGFGAADREARRIDGPFRKMERLYASVDELIYKPDRTVQDAYPLLTGFPAGFTQQQQTDFYRFFLTTTSRAPDLNLFGKPRVGLWPLHVTDSTNTRTVFDNLIARCNTVGPLHASNIYYFQRERPLSQTHDWDNIPRNQNLYAYLQDATSRLVPGFGGGSFLSKYDESTEGSSGERDQILTEIFDYIRCVNLNEVYRDKGASFQSYTTTLRFTGSQGSLDDVGAEGAGAGFVLPIKIGDTRGMGRVPSLSEVALSFISDYSAPEGVEKVYSALFLESFTSMAGYMPWLPPENFSVRISGSTALIETTGDPVTVPVPSILHVKDATVRNLPIFPNVQAGVTMVQEFRNPYIQGQTIAGTVGANWLGPQGGSISGIAAAGPSSVRYLGVGSGPYPFYTPRFSAVEMPGEQLTLKGGVLKVEFGINGNPFQTYHIKVPDGTLPRPIKRVGPHSTPQTRYIYQIEDEDVVRSIVPTDGDMRVIACLQDVPEGFFKPHAKFTDVSTNFAHSLQFRPSNAYYKATFGSFLEDGSGPLSYWQDAGGAPYYEYRGPDIDPSITDLRLQKGWTGDWSTGIGTLRDGGFTLKSDEGELRFNEKGPNYFEYWNWSAATAFFSPIRQIPSAGLFGTLPSGVKRTEKAYRDNKPEDAAPWRTLLFCPNPDAAKNHLGFKSPEDYLLLDLFHMPVVEPYAISEPLSTAGRINMNSQLMPFTGIVRDTGLHAVLSSHKVTALSPSLALKYKRSESTDLYRFRVNVNETLKQFHERFAPNGNPVDGDLFRSPAEICSIYLIPNTAATYTGVAGPTLASSGIKWNGTSLSVPSMETWWEGYRLTADNLRERPYAMLYPLLTTKSNTYTVHMIAQTISVKKSGPDFKVTVKGEYRGSSTIERYIDPADPRIGTGSGQTNPDTQSLEPLYRFRIVDTKRFAP